MKCVVCQQPLDQVDPNVFVHPMCDAFAVTDQEDPDVARIKEQLTEIIRWYDKQSPRSKQADLGPSELGSPCDRRLGYRMAGIPKVNQRFDPWSAIMGTAIHAWLADAINAWSLASDNDDFIVEHSVQINEIIRSHADLFDKKRGIVIDHKSAGPDVMKKIREDSPPAGYRIQIQVYGYAYEKLGYKVNKCALAFYPRTGWLKNMYVWVEPYDRSVAEAALKRPYEVANTLINLDVLSNPRNWAAVPCAPAECGWCPWFNPQITAEQGASSQGCPGS